MEKTDSGRSARGVRGFIPSFHRCESMPSGVFWSLENHQSCGRDNQSYIFTNWLHVAGNPLRSRGNWLLDGGNGLGICGNPLPSLGNWLWDSGNQLPCGGNWLHATCNQLPAADHWLCSADDC